MGRSTEYRGKIIDEEFKNKTHFICDICCRRLSKIQMDVHHRKPQLAGKDDSRENLSTVDTTCHATIHRLALSLTGTSNKEKVPALEIARDFAASVNPGFVDTVQKNLLEAATLVAQAIHQKKNKLVKPTSDVTTNLDLPPQFNALYKVLAKTITDGNGKPIGKSRLTLMCVLTFIAGRYPGEKANEIQAYIFEHVLRSGKVKKHKSTGIVGRKL